MPTKPRTAKKAAGNLQLAAKAPATTRPRTATRPSAPAPAGEDGVLQWDAYIAEVEAAGEGNPWRMRLPDGELLEVGCPSSEDVDALSLAQAQGDVQHMFEAVFKEHADTLLNLTAKLPFTARVKLVNDLMLHHGMGNLTQLPESDASSD